MGGIPVTKLESAPATLTNYPSSVVNGVTQEGGLFSLTFKSVTCAELVQNLDLMRDAISPAERQSVPKFANDLANDKSYLEKLKEDVEKLRQQEVPPLDDSIGKLQSQLDEALDQHQLGDVSKHIRQEYQERNPDKTLLLDMGTPIHLIVVPGLEVEQAAEDDALLTF